MSEFFFCSLFVNFLGKIYGNRKNSKAIEDLSEEKLNSIRNTNQIESMRKLDILIVDDSKR
jgi:hypothetical protein